METYYSHITRSPRLFRCSKVASHPRLLFSFCSIILSLWLCCLLLPRWLLYFQPPVCGPVRRKKKGRKEQKKRESRGMWEGKAESVWRGQPFSPTPNLTLRVVSHDKKWVTWLPSYKGVGAGGMLAGHIALLNNTALLLVRRHEFGVGSLQCLCLWVES